MKYQSIRIMKKTSTLDLKDSPHRDSRFYRYEYWGIDSMFILHYFEGVSTPKQQIQKETFY